MLKPDHSIRPLDSIGLPGLSLLIADWNSSKSIVLDIRNKVASELSSEDDTDHISQHSIIMRGAEPLGTIRHYSAQDIISDFETYLSVPFPKARAGIYCSSRTFIDGRSGESTPALLRGLFSCAREGYLAGARVSVITAPIRVAPLYKRFTGYRAMPGEPFHHPRTGREVVSLYRVIDPREHGIAAGKPPTPELTHWLNALNEATNNQKLRA